MNRREFVTKTCLACIGGGLLSTIITSCKSTHYVTGTLEGKGLFVNKSEFDYSKNGKALTRPYILVHQDKLEFPIYLFRFSDTDYSALWMKCSHQGSELQASGDHLYCSSHGSEFDNRGNVSQGPAGQNLRSFKVTANNDKIFIELT
jgi:Rieske Fe-S protein